MDDPRRLRNDRTNRLPAKGQDLSCILVLPRPHHHPRSIPSNRRNHPQRRRRLIQPRHRLPHSTPIQADLILRQHQRHKGKDLPLRDEPAGAVGDPSAKRLERRRVVTLHTFVEEPLGVEARDGLGSECGVIEVQLAVGHEEFGAWLEAAGTEHGG